MSDRATVFPAGSGAGALAEAGLPPGMIVIFIVLFIIALRWLFGGSRRGPWEEQTLEARLARKVRGAVIEQGGPTGALIFMKIRGRPAELRVAPEGDLAAPTVVEVDMRGTSPGTLQIVPDHRANDLFRGRPGAIATGDPAFDAKWAARAVPESLVREIFSHERRAAAVASVQRLALHAGASIALSRERLVVRVQEALRDESLILQLVETADDFVGYIVQVEPLTGVLWVEVTREAGGQCQVCGTEMREQVVYCAKCRTPHHEDCWRYMGECSTFGCKERRFIREAT